MQKRKIICLLMCLSLFLLTQALWAQTPVTVKVWATDGSGLTDTVKLAVHPAGTIGVDSIGPNLREAELPPAPEGFEIRVASLAGFDNFGPGSYTSIHHLTRDTQTDKYKIQYQIDPLRSSITFSWPAGLGSVGAGLWRMIPNPSDADLITFPDVDMTSSTSKTINVPNSDPHFVYIVKGDGKEFRSFQLSEIAGAVDSKGKHAGEKRKANASEGTFVFTNTTSGQAKTDIHIEWSEGIDGGSFSVTPATASITWADPPKNTKVDIVFLAADTIPNGASVTIYARGNKGKTLVAKKWWWTLNNVQTPPKQANASVNPNGGGRLRFPMGNINNIGEELYSQTAFGANGIDVGTDPTTQSGVDIKGKPIFKGVIHPKWKDALTTISGGGKTGPATGPPRCLDQTDDTKPIVKIQKGLSPAKYNSTLLGEAVALSFNIGSSDFEKTATGFGSLVYDSTGGGDGSFNGKTVQMIRDSLNTIMQCHTSVQFSNDINVWQAVVHRINGAFSGTFDTVNFVGPTLGGHPKANGTVATGVKAVYDVPYLHRTSLLDQVMVHNYPNIQALEALPKKYQLAQNYPNPFNPTTTIEFSLPEDAMVTIRVYNMLGQEVTTLADNEQFSSGVNEVTFDASKYASGVYYYRMIVNGGQFQQVKKMMLMK